LASKTQEDEIRAVLNRVGANFLKALEQSKDYHDHFREAMGKLIDDMIVKIKEERQSW
jgi:glycine cleavage system aminomethyltransferase T